MSQVSAETFYPSIPVFRGFAQLMEPSLYRSLPEDWTIGVADVVGSTSAIAARRYKAVNMAGAAVIAAVTNALKGLDFPFVFGGDGASFAVSAEQLETARGALAATAAWVREDLGLVLRVALVPLSAIRAQGHDVRVARYGPSANVSYAMFSGGGIGWAEAAMKRGEFAVAPGPPGAQPDLTGLSCRFEEIPAARGLILSLLVVPTARVDPVAFRHEIEKIITYVENSPDAGRPVPKGGPPLKWPPKGVDFEARARRGGSLMARKAEVLVRTLLYYLVMRFGIKVGNFRPDRYTQEVVENSDFRKYDDGLRMVLDCSKELALELDGELARAAAHGILRYGLHMQDAALMTCFTLSAARANHVHFIDGAGGGYTAAATALKAVRID
jgi:Protein of unknown function (DUF3095)